MRLRARCKVTSVTVFGCVAVLVVAACTPPQPTHELEEARPSATSPSAPAEEAETVATPLPPTRHPIRFVVEDGQELEGTYYPAATNPAPVVVLMHWARGDASSWVEIAHWLQNRGQGGQTKPAEPWLDPSWFPAVPDGLSLAVFTFTFRGCGEGSGCQSFDPDGWLLDAVAAMETARALEGADPERIVAIGASIGADGAADACKDGCVGAVSLSPGSYLGIPFGDAVTALANGDPSRPVWCLAAEGDTDSAEACGEASGDLYRMLVYPGSDHGMMLVRPDKVPGTLGVILEFLELTLGD